ncbi:MAG: hypothetical protein FWD48_11645 [Oscillospiraceae bacterium]|nr:hypothetical protein [Oscillospiraceae bacterium]
MNKFSIAFAIGFGLSFIVAILSIVFGWDTQWNATAIGLMTCFGGAIFVVNVKSPAKSKYKSTHPVIRKAHNWLDSKKCVIREKHNLKLKLKLIKKGDESFIEVAGEHTYDLSAPNEDKQLKYFVNIYTDLGRQGDETSGGFKFVRIGDEVFEGDTLSGMVEPTNKVTKICFKRSVTIPKGNSLNFKYRTFAEYRLSDRLIWTVQDLSDGLNLSVEDKTGLSNNNMEDLLFWLNHHKRDIIEHEIIRNRANKTVTINFPCPVYPSQGFEMAWDYEGKSKKKPLITSQSGSG